MKRNSWKTQNNTLLSLYSGSNMLFMDITFCHKEHVTVLVNVTNEP